MREEEGEKLNEVWAFSAAMTDRSVPYEKAEEGKASQKNTKDKAPYNPTHVPLQLQLEGQR